MKKRLLAMMMAVSMIGTSVPMNAWAEADVQLKMEDTIETEELLMAAAEEPAAEAEEEDLLGTFEDTAIVMDEDIDDEEFIEDDIIAIGEDAVDENLDAEGMGDPLLEDKEDSILEEEIFGSLFMGEDETAEDVITQSEVEEDPKNLVEDDVEEADDALLTADDATSTWTWSISEDHTVLTISGQGRMSDYLSGYGASNYAPWYGYREEIENVEIEEGITSIGNYAFHNCAILSSIVIPSSVTSIGEDTFYGCSSLSSIEIPSSVKSIGNEAFKGCSNLSSIEIPSGVTSIVEDTFYGCSSLSSIEIPSSVKSIGDRAFWGCSNLSSIEIPSGVTSIGEGTFFGCSSLSSIEIPSRVKSIGASAFSGCSSLSSIEIPSSVTSIGAAAFYVCSSLSSIEIPSRVKSIGASVFEYCSSLSSIEIPISVTSIGERAFDHCSSLSSIEIPNGVTSIGYFVFGGCSSLSSIKIPSSVTSIGRSAFYGCSSLSSIEIPSSVTSIGEGAFYGCSSLSSIEIPSSVKSIESITFKNCSSLSNIGIPSSVTSVGSSAFYGCSTLSNIEIPSSVTSIDGYAFGECGSLSSIDIPTGVTSIGQGTFANCGSLSSIGIPSSVTSIGYRAFYSCSSLKDVYYEGDEDSWSKITRKADNDCLTNATIHYGVGSGTKINVSSLLTTLVNEEFDIIAEIKNYKDISKALPVTWTVDDSSGLELSTPSSEVITTTTAASSISATPLKAGTYTVTATTADGVSASTMIEVLTSTTIDISTPSEDIFAGDEFTLSANVKNEQDVSSTLPVTWVADDPEGLILNTPMSEVNSTTTAVSSITANAKKVGTYTVAATTADGAVATVEITVKLRKVNITSIEADHSIAEHQIKLTWDAVPGADGYEVQWSKSSTFDDTLIVDDVVSYDHTKGMMDTSETSFTISYNDDPEESSKDTYVMKSTEAFLYRDKTYYVRVRAYVDSKNDEATREIVGEWSDKSKR